jgi:hypothetical protein
MGSFLVCSPGKPSGAWYEAADPFGSISPTLPDLESALASLDPPADDPVPIRSGGKPRGCWRPSCGVVFEPMGVARRSAGGIGRARLGCTSLDSFEPFTTGLAFGDAGIERPRRGGRPPPPARPPGTGGRRRGTVDDMVGCGLKVAPLV